MGTTPTCPGTGRSFNRNSRPGENGLLGRIRRQNQTPPLEERVRAALPLHVVMRSGQAVGKRSLLVKSGAVAKILEVQAARHFIRILGAASAGNHLHLLIQAPSQNQLSNFLRAITGRIAQMMTETVQRKGTGGGAAVTGILAAGRLNLTDMTVMPRDSARAMFEKIHQALREGLIPRTPGLVAAGFG